ELHERLAHGSLGDCANMATCTYRPEIFTREDINKLGFKDLQPLASAGAYQNVPESCPVTIAGRKQTAFVWMLSSAEIEMLEVYMPKRARADIKPDSVLGARAVVPRAPAPIMAQCPTIIAWIRK
ncbi:MAG TPA: hypothetical protein VF483_09525, partial [Gemmatimonadaceae bacterium]